MAGADRQEFVRTDEIGVVSWITFGSTAHNALSSDLLKRLAEAILMAGSDPRSRLIVLQSDGDQTFCAGANLDELLAIKDEASGKAFFGGFAHVINAIRTCGKLVIGRVQGKAIGGGVGLAAACDYCFACEQAAVKLSELSIHIGPFVIAPVVERKTGLAAFTKLCLTPTRFRDAQWAKQHGLFQSVSSGLTEMDTALRSFITELGQKNSHTLYALKTTLWHNTMHWDTLLYEQAAISGKLILHPEARAALQSFRKGASS